MSCAGPFDPGAAILVKKTGDKSKISRRVNVDDSQWKIFVSPDAGATFVQRRICVN